MKTYNMNIKKITTISTGLAMVASLALAVPALAVTNSNGNGSGDDSRQGGGQNENRTGMMGVNSINRGPGMMGANVVARGPGMMKPGVYGKVTAVNGNIITVSGRTGFGATPTTVQTSYTVDATNAVIKKNNATSTLSAIAVGDMIAVQGTVTGTNVVATSIFDGIGGRMMGNKGGNGNENENGQNSGGPGKMWSATSTQVIGNGQPVVAGTVSAVNGTTITVTTASNVVYTVNAASAKVLDGQNTIALSNVIVGNKVVVQGTINGNSVTASTIVDQVAVASVMPGKSQGKGFFGGIGQFFMHMFGF
jgi:hypothetical protein